MRQPIPLTAFESASAALQKIGFEIEFAEYLDGKINGAVKDTWHDGREYVGVIARKPG